MDEGKGKVEDNLAVQLHGKSAISDRLKRQNLGLTGVPSSILQNRSVSVLECIAKFLKDEKKLSYHEIAVLLSRDERTIWTCYNRAKTKEAMASKVKRPTVSIPFSAIRNRDVSVLESVVVYLKEKKDLRYSEIAKLLGRDDRTVWTVYNRANRKLKQSDEKDQKGDQKTKEEVHEKSEIDGKN